MSVVERGSRSTGASRNVAAYARLATAHFRLLSPTTRSGALHALGARPVGPAHENGLLSEPRQVDAGARLYRRAIRPQPRRDRRSDLDALHRFGLRSARHGHA